MSQTSFSKHDQSPDQWRFKWLFGQTQLPDDQFVDQLESAVLSHQGAGLRFQPIKWWRQLSLVGFPVVLAILVMTLFRPQPVFSPTIHQPIQAQLSDHAASFEEVALDQQTQLASLDALLLEIEIAPR